MQVCRTCSSANACFQELVKPFARPQEIEAQSTRAAFLSTPSLYFSLKNKELKDNSYVFDVSHRQPVVSKLTPPPRFPTRPHSVFLNSPIHLLKMYSFATPPCLTVPGQLDEQWAKYKTFVRYDFNQPLDIPEALHHTFDCVVCEHSQISLMYTVRRAAAISLCTAASGVRRSPARRDCRQRRRGLRGGRGLSIVSRYSLSISFQCR